MHKISSLYIMIPADLSHWLNAHGLTDALDLFPITSSSIHFPSVYLNASNRKKCAYFQVERRVSHVETNQLVCPAPIKVVVVGHHRHFNTTGSQYYNVFVGWVPCLICPSRTISITSSRASVITCVRLLICTRIITFMFS